MVHEEPADNVSPESGSIFEPVTAVIVPLGQLLVRPGATRRPPGMVSVNAIPFSEFEGFELVTVKVTLVSVTKLISVLAKDPLSAGGARETNVAVAVFPVPALEPAVTELPNVAQTLAITLALMVQDEEAANVMPVRVMVPEPDTAVIVPLGHVVLSPLGVDAGRPDGKLSVKLMPARELPFGLVKVNIRLATPLTGTVAEPNASEIVAGMGEEALPETTKFALDPRKKKHWRQRY